jgi:hypothetical protein
MMIGVQGQSMVNVSAHPIAGTISQPGIKRLDGFGRQFMNTQDRMQTNHSMGQTGISHHHIG